MNKPVFGPRNALTLEQLMQNAGPSGWDFFDKLLPQEAAKQLQPSERVAKFLAALAQSGDGIEVIEWLMDITMRLPLRATGTTIEETALRTATRQGINGVAEAVLSAIALGEKLLNNEQPRS